VRWEKVFCKSKKNLQFLLVIVIVQASVSNLSEPGSGCATNLLHCCEKVCGKIFFTLRRSLTVIRAAIMYSCGVDVGGTKILAVLLDESGTVVARHKLKTGKERGPV
jgi:hypothetical protein